MKRSSSVQPPMQIARLSQAPGADFRSIQASFAERNPGYQLEYYQGVRSLESRDFPRILFVQEGQPQLQLIPGKASKTSVGDIILLKAGVELQADSALSMLCFSVPEPPADSIPSIIRPDWDPYITDIPGGCATDSNAYRRILLTWKPIVGRYLYHALNAHRVRITNSFSHYHPEEGGFDEFYLVQMVQADARIITSEYVPLLCGNESQEFDQISDLFQTTPLEIGDLVYIPRGLMHRGIGGILAQVITVPGFIPGAEIGLDHHIKAFNQRMKLSGADTLPYNVEASHTAIIK